jgi:Flp pilus assembly pilin Flp
MRHLMLKLWRDDQGALIATEWVFIATILVIGLVTGLKSVQQALNNELEEIAGAIGALSQSYSVGGTSGCCSSTNGSSFTDTTNTFLLDSCTEATDGTGDNCPD